jgi:hypothetical protein
VAGIKGKVGARDLKKFKDGLSKMNGAQRQLWNEAALKELAARLLAKVIKRTPVGQYPASSGKKGGTLRRNWTVGEVVKNGNEYRIEVINPTEYAPYVEFGHRTADHAGWVEGQFFLTASEQELQADAPRLLASKLGKFLGGVLK